MFYREKTLFVFLILFLCNAGRTATTDPDSPPLRPLAGFTKIADSPGLDLWEIVPAKAGLGYKLEIFDLKGTVAAHFHQAATQTITVMTGALEVHTKTQEGVESTLILKEAEALRIPPTLLHRLTSIGGWARYSSFSSPAFEYPQDVYDASGTALTE
jgi:quercetin dioxygenase-like cupin family protein